MDSVGKILKIILFQVRRIRETLQKYVQYSEGIERLLRQERN